MATNRPDLNEVLVSIKRDYITAIRSGGRDHVHSLIRSQKLIMYIHEFIKQDLVFHGINPSKIFPPPGKTKPELKMAGFLKTKNQDITILHKTPIPEKIQEGVLLGKTDAIGKNISKQAISVNIRSQLSSLGKNFDTLYERTFAEALNLHLRTQNLIMGEVYMVPIIAYDPDLINEKKIGFDEILPSYYIPAFNFLNGRKSPKDDLYKYDRLCLLIIDFREDPPKVITSASELVKDEIISKKQSKEKEYSLAGMDIDTFVPDLLNIYKKRHGSLRPLS